MSNLFAPPAAATGGIKWADHHGALLIIQPVSEEKNIQTANGARDAIRANAYVIDGPGAPETYEDTLIFPKVLVSQLRPRLGQLVIGRVAQGASKPGQNPPWILAEATVEDVSLGVQAWERIKANQFTQPTTQPQAQATQPQAAQPVQQAQQAQQAAPAFQPQQQAFGLQPQPNSGRPF